MIESREKHRGNLGNNLGNNLAFALNKEKQGARTMSGRRSAAWLLILCLLLLHGCQEVVARRGRARSRSKSRMQIGLPITGKYRDPESDQYYNNQHVSLHSTAINPSAFFIPK